MDVEAALRKRLLDDAAVSAIVDDRIYWEERIQGDNYPGITLQIFDEDRRQHLKGFDSLQPLFVQIDGWALTHATGKLIKDAAIACLVPQVTIEGFKFNRGFVRARDLTERSEALGRTIFRPSMDFTLNYSVVS